MSDPLVALWPPFGLEVTCGPLRMRVLRDSDFAEVMPVVHAGIHAPDEMPFFFPWTDARGAEMDRQFLAYHWRARAEMTPTSWDLNLGVWRDGEFVGVQGVATRDFPITRTGETGSWLGRRFQGLGTGTLMRQAMCVLGFDHLGFEEITSAAFTDNPASLAVSRKVGYRADGDRRYVRRDRLAINRRLVLRPEDLVRPAYDVEVQGVEALVDFLGMGPSDQTEAT